MFSSHLMEIWKGKRCPTQGTKSIAMIIFTTLSQDDPPTGGTRAVKKKVELDIQAVIFLGSQLELGVLEPALFRSMIFWTFLKVGYVRLPGGQLKNPTNFFAVPIGDKNIIEGFGGMRIYRDGTVGDPKTLGSQAIMSFPDKVRSTKQKANVDVFFLIIFNTLNEYQQKTCRSHNIHK